MKFNPWIFVLIFFVCLVFAVKYLLPYFTPFFIGLLIAVILHPAIDKLEQYGLSRTLLSFLFVGITFGGLLVLIGIGISELWQEIAQLLILFEQGYNETSELAQKFTSFAKDLPKPLSDMAITLSQRVAHFFITQLTTALDYIKEIPNAMLTFVVAALATYFISKDRTSIIAFLLNNIPAHFRPICLNFKDQTILGLFAYLKAQLVLMTISTGISVLGLVMLGVPYAWILGLVAGFLDLIPMIGPSGVFIPTIAFYVLNDQMIMGVLLACLWVFVLLLRQWWEPQIISSGLGLHPLSSLVAMYLGVQLLGFSGFFIGPIILICLKAFYVAIVFEDEI